jgi:hypothetical protein
VLQYIVPTNNLHKITVDFEVVLLGWNLQPAQQLYLLDLLHQGTCLPAITFHMRHMSHTGTVCLQRRVPVRVSMLAAGG